MWAGSAVASGAGLRDTLDALASAEPWGTVMRAVIDAAVTFRREQRQESLKLICRALGMEVTFTSGSDDPAELIEIREE